MAGGTTGLSLAIADASAGRWSAAKPLPPLFADIQVTGNAEPLPVAGLNFRR